MLGKLHIAQLELEVQNEELSASALTLENERSRFAGFFNLAPVGYFILDKLGLVAEVNLAGTVLLKLTRDQILGKRLQIFIAPEDWSLFYGFFHRLQTIDVKQQLEIRLTPSDGKEVWAYIEGISVSHHYAGELQYYITITDISESRLAQKTLLQTSQRLEMILKASATGTWTMGLGNQRIFLDDFSHSVLGIKPWEFDGSIVGFVQLLHPDDRVKARSCLLNAHKSSGEVDLEFRVMGKNKELRLVAVKGHQVQDEVNGDYFAGIVMDITERKRLEQKGREVERAQQKRILSATFSAQEKEREQISSALHDSVCQILYGIKLNIQNIQINGKSKADFKNINQLLDQAIRETRELSYGLTPSILRDFGFIEGVKEMAQRLTTPDFRIKTELKNVTDQLNPDIQLYVFRIIQELVNNCIKHARATEVVIKVSTTDGWVDLIISDNGRGFPAGADEALAKGSGLRAIKNRVFLLNGTIDLETSGNGTRIMVSFQPDASHQLSGVI